MGRGEERAWSTKDEWRDRQPGERAVDARRRATSPTSSTRSSTSTISYDTEAPLAWTHNRVEGRSEYTQLLYIPAQGAVRPVEPRQARRREAVRQARLHHGRRRALMPVYLRFVKGVIDSSRPAAQRLARAAAGKPRREGDPRRLDQARAVDARRPGRQRGRAPRRTSTPTFWKEFGAVLKEGIGEDHANRERLAKLLRFASTHADGRRRTSRWPTTSARMKEGQEAIYYVTADTLARREEQPAARDLPQEGHRGAAADRPRRRVGAVAPERVRRQAAAERRQGRPSTSARCRTRPRRRQPRKVGEAFKPLLEQA